MIELSLSRAVYDVARELAADGAINREIGARLSITEDTVKSHMKVLLKLSGCLTRTEFAVKVARNQIRLHKGKHTHLMHAHVGAEAVQEPLEVGEVA